MLMQRFNGGVRAAALILHQRHMHPTHAWSLFIRAIKDVLALDDFLILAAQRPVALHVAHGHFAGAIQEVPVRNGEIDSASAAPAIEITDDLPLPPLGILIALVAGVNSGGAAV